MFDIDKLDLELLFPKDVHSAIEIQRELSGIVKIHPLQTERIEYISGVDVSYSGNFALSVIVTLDTTMNIVEIVSERVKVEFPYISGLLAFREAPAIIKCLEKVLVKPDIIIFDGQGIAHPRGLGIASHVGVLLDIPTIGVAKSRLYGTCKKPKQVGESEPILDEKGNLIGYSYLSKKSTNPLYISPGHLCDPASALSLVKQLINGYKLPEPTRLAHLYTQKLKAELG